MSKHILFHTIGSNYRKQLSITGLCHYFDRMVTRCQEAWTSQKAQIFRSWKEIKSAKWSIWWVWRSNTWSKHHDHVITENPSISLPHPDSFLTLTCMAVHNLVLHNPGWKLGLCFNMEFPKIFKILNGYTWFAISSTGS